MRPNDGAPIFSNQYRAGHFPGQAQIARLSIGSTVGHIGYPENHDALDLRPLFRSGRVASDPRYPFAIPGDGQQQKIMGHVVAYDGFSWGGSSGGPVLWFGPEVSHALVIGVNAGHLSSSESRRHAGERAQHSGLSYFYRADVLMGLINSVFLGNEYAAPFPWLAPLPTSTRIVGRPEKRAPTL